MDPVEMKFVNFEDYFKYSENIIYMPLGETGCRARRVLPASKSPCIRLILGSLRKKPATRGRAQLMQNISLGFLIHVFHDDLVTTSDCDPSRSKERGDRLLAVYIFACVYGILLVIPEVDCCLSFDNL